MTARGDQTFAGERARSEGSMVDVAMRDEEAQAEPASNVRTGSPPAEGTPSNTIAAAFWPSWTDHAACGSRQAGCARLVHLVDVTGRWSEGAANACRA
jgi:hypothetical protein